MPKTKPTKYAFKLEHPYGGDLLPYGDDQDIVIRASTVPELMEKLSDLFEFEYEAVPTSTPETV